MKPNFIITILALALPIISSCATAEKPKCSSFDFGKFALGEKIPTTENIVCGKADNGAFLCKFKGDDGTEYITQDRIVNWKTISLARISKDIIPDFPVGQDMASQLSKKYCEVFKVGSRTLTAGENPVTVESMGKTKTGRTIAYEIIIWPVTKADPEGLVGMGPPADEDGI